MIVVKSTLLAFVIFSIVCVWAFGFTERTPNMKIPLWADFLITWTIGFLTGVAFSTYINFRERKANRSTPTPVRRMRY